MSVAIYIGLIVAVNWSFSILPMIQIPGGTLPSAAFLVGFIFVARDFAQREIGHKVIGAMLVAGVISYFMASPAIAYASVAAFGISELADWAVYSFTKRPFAQRILYSSALGTPLDSAVFLYMIGFGSVAGVAAMTAAKMVGALIVWRIVSRRAVD